MAASLCHKVLYCVRAALFETKASLALTVVGRKTTDSRGGSNASECACLTLSTSLPDICFSMTNLLISNLQHNKLLFRRLILFFPTLLSVVTLMFAWVGRTGMDSNFIWALRRLILCGKSNENALDINLFVKFLRLLLSSAESRSTNVKCALTRLLSYQFDTGLNCMYSNRTRRPI